jgi:hypothetical protein
MMRRRSMVTAIMVGTLAAGCAAIVALVLLSRPWSGRERSPSTTQLRQSLSDVVAPLQLRPFGNESVEPVAVKVKTDPVYYTSTGVAALPQEAARLKLVRVLQSQGWTLRRQGDVDHFLGWEAVAVRGSMVLLASIGEEAAGVNGTPYQRHAGHSYVQIAVAGRNSGPEWSREGT